MSTWEHQGWRPGMTRDNPICLDDDSDDGATTPCRKTGSKEAAARLSSCTLTPRSTRKRKATGDEDGEPSPREKRLRSHRRQPPQAFHDVYARALTQRFFVLERRRGGSHDAPHETFTLAGSTGNVYTVRIDCEPSCDCPHAVKGNQCKHVLYILAKVLHAPHELVYQLALLPSELRQILAAAPSDGGADGGGSGKRRPVEGDCPICYSELDAANSESLVWCRAACGQNMHQECFDMWARTKKDAGQRVPCPMCRSEWWSSPAAVSAVRVDGARGREGYVNVARQLGISTRRDTSTYSTWYRERMPW